MAPQEMDGYPKMKRWLPEMPLMAKKQVPHPGPSVEPVEVDPDQILGQPWECPSRCGVANLANHF